MGAEIGSMNIPGLLEDSAKKHPHRKAIYIGWKSVSYRALDALANRWAQMLREKYGVKQGDRVALLLKNCPEFIYALFGIQKLGAAVVPVNNFLKGPEIAYILKDAAVRTVVTTRDFQPALEEAKDFLPSVIYVDSPETASALSGFPAEPPAVPIDPGQDAVVIYTSGTTGKPKGAILTHTNICSNADASVRTIGCKLTDRFLLILPMFHSFTFTVCIMMPLSIGAGIVLVPSVQPFSRVLRNMIFRKATLFAAVPQIFQVLAAKKIPGWLRPLVRLRLCVSGAAALPGSVLEAFEKNIGIPLLEGYGLSEASPVVSINPLHGVRKPGTVGLPIPGVTVRIVDDTAKPVPAGQIGEVAVQGPNVMKGYLNNPAATAQSIKDGWLLTGDMGVMDKDGYIKIVDRKKEMIIVRGMNVYPKEVEDVLVTHPAVAAAAVVGKLDGHRGECPMAAVILKPGAAVTSKELLRYCQERLADYKLPRKVLFVENFPRNPTGKILKRELVTLF